MGDKKPKVDISKIYISDRLRDSILNLNNLRVEEAKQTLIQLYKLISKDRESISDFQDEIFVNVDFSDDKFRQEFTIDELVVNDVYELSESLRGFRILAQAYNIHCKPKKIIIRSTN